MAIVLLPEKKTRRRTPGVFRKPPAGVHAGWKRVFGWNSGTADKVGAPPGPPKPPPTPECAYNVRWEPLEGASHDDCLVDSTANPMRLGLDAGNVHARLYSFLKRLKNFKLY